MKDGRAIKKADESKLDSTENHADKPLFRILAGIFGSISLHVFFVLFLLSNILQAQQPSVSIQKDRTVSFDVVETIIKKTPPEPKPEPLPKPEPEPEPTPVLKTPPPPPVKAPPPAPQKAKAPPKSPEPAKKSPPDYSPPPSNDPGGEPISEPVPINVGISLRSTVGETSQGGLRMGVGNTLYGSPERKAADPSESRPYSGGSVPEETITAPPPPPHVPVHRVTALPSVRREVRAEYPEIPRREGIEGRVILHLRIDATGKVVEAEVIEGPHHELNEAAREALMQFIFRPAMLNGDPVSTELRYTYTFMLD